MSTQRRRKQISSTMTALKRERLLEQICYFQVLWNEKSENAITDCDLHAEFDGEEAKIRAGVSVWWRDRFM